MKKTAVHYTDVMVDLETLGTTADSVIMSIGAVRFCAAGTEMSKAAFYASISIESNIDAGRTISEATVVWWLQQSPAAQRVFHEEKQTLGSALTSFAEWFGDNDQCVWGNGSDFDVAMLAHAYRSFKLETPWQFWNTRCFRSIKASSLGRRVAAPIRTGLAHHALDDAKYQAEYLQKILAVAA